MIKSKYGLYGSDHPRWKGGRHPDSGTGYIWVYSPAHPYRTIHNRVAEHRLVMEKHLGRYLSVGEVVHHKNGIRNDNRLSNLELSTQSEHIAAHNRRRIWKMSSRRKHQMKVKKFVRDDQGRFVGYAK